MPQLKTNGVTLEYEAFGDRGAPPLLLIMGLGAQMILWPDDFCRSLAAAGHYVVRYDNRDTGLSTQFREARRPNLVLASIASALRLPLSVPYTLDDMARDAVGLLDGLDLGSAHIVGASMGGMIAQILAARHADRLRSLTLLMTSSGNPRLPRARPAVQLQILRGARQRNREAMVRHSMRTWDLISSPAYPVDRDVLRAKVERQIERNADRSGFARQALAIIASGNRAPLLRRISAPTLIIHGHDDPLVPVAAGHELARLIPGSRLEVIPGMGHDLPGPLLPRFTRLILEHAAAVEQAPPPRRKPHKNAAAKR